MTLYYNRDGSQRSDYGYMDSEERRVAETTVGQYWISTVFLIIDHQYGDGPPLIFETMVFIGKDMASDQYCDRYSTEEQALAGHKKVVAHIEKYGTPPSYEDDL